MNTKTKKRIILARYNNQKKQALARAQVMAGSILGSVQLNHIISAPIPKTYADGGVIGIPGPLAGVDLQDRNDAAAREIELAMTWNPAIVGGPIYPLQIALPDGSPWPPKTVFTPWTSGDNGRELYHMTRHWPGPILQRHWPLLGDHYYPKPRWFDALPWIKLAHDASESKTIIQMTARGHSKTSRMFDAYQELIIARIRDLQAIDPAHPGIAKCNRILKSMCICRHLSHQATQMVNSLQILKKCSQELTTALSRINQPNFKHHHRKCRNRTGK